MMLFFVPSIDVADPDDRHFSRLQFARGDRPGGRTRAAVPAQLFAQQFRPAFALPSGKRLKSTPMLVL